MTNTAGQQMAMNQIQPVQQQQQLALPAPPAPLTLPAPAPVPPAPAHIPVPIIVHQYKPAAIMNAGDSIDTVDEMDRRGKKSHLAAEF